MKKNYPLPLHQMKDFKTKKNISSPTYKLICLFLNDALQPFDEFNTYFQSEEPKIHLLQSKLQILVKSLLIRYIKPSALLGVKVSEEPKIHLLQSKLQILVKSLLIRYIKPSALLGVRVTEVDNLNKANLKDNPDLHLGQAASDFMERKNEVHLREEK
ncbi:zinc finger BED domain-containing protein 5 [Biomphalaria glabrata]|nr:zinc finger BED domain-containing protein 5 [Biomphalaria glabrata]